MQQGAHFDRMLLIPHAEHYRPPDHEERSSQGWQWGAGPVPLLPLV
jgi:hypothetical protein